MSENFPIWIVYALAKLLVVSIPICVGYVGWRSGRESSRRHFFFLTSFTILFIGNLLFLLSASLDAFFQTNLRNGFLILYYTIEVVGLLMMIAAFESAEHADRRDILRRRGRMYITLGGLLMAAAIVFTVQWLHDENAEIAFVGLRWQRLMIFGMELAAIVWLIKCSMSLPRPFFSERQTYLFLASCLVLVAACAMRMLPFSVGIEHFRTIANCFIALSYGAIALILVKNLLDEFSETGRRLLDQKDRELMVYREIATRLNSTFELHDLFDTFIDDLLEIMHAEAGAIFLIDEDGKTLSAKVVRGCFPPPVQVPEYAKTREKFLHELIMSTKVKMGQGLIGKVADEGELLFVEDVSKEEGIEQTIPELMQIKTTLVLPLKRQESVYGVIHIVNKWDGTSFSREDIQFAELIVEQAALAIYNARVRDQMIEKQRTERELQIARDIQLRLIPSEVPKIQGYDIDAVYRAAHEVGGDYYDFYLIDEDHLGIVIADVSGKGVPGALIMTMTRTILKILAANDLSTARTMSKINESIAPEIRRGMFVTAIYGILNLKTRKLLFSRAGHNPLIAFRKSTGSFERLCPKGIALGFVPPNRFDKTIEEQEIILEPGDRIFFYTDGVTEAMNQNMEEFGEARFQSFIARNGHSTCKDLLDALLKEIDNHRGQQPQYDDISLVALTVGDESSP